MSNTDTTATAPPPAPAAPTVPVPALPDDGGKSMWTSRGAVGALVAAGASGIVLASQVANLAGYTVSPDDQTQAITLWTTGVTAIAGLVGIGAGIMALVGRILATRQIR